MGNVVADAGKWFPAGFGYHFQMTAMLGENSEFKRTDARAVKIEAAGAAHVSGILNSPPQSRACYVLAHGAGAGMAHPFLAGIAEGLAARGIATLRFQFPYMEQRSRRPDPPEVAHSAVRAAVAEAARLLPNLPLFAGGKSFGGRMTSQAQALAPLDGVHGLVFLGFPLHPAGKPSDERAKHLFDVRTPMLFLQGTRDELADLKLLEPVCEKLAKSNRSVTLKLFEADHSFHVPARSGRKDADVKKELLNTVVEWIDRVIGATSH
jgi:predicted alpha/beta-hydrolase family hydrolase